MNVTKLTAAFLISTALWVSTAPAQSVAQPNAPKALLIQAEIESRKIELESLIAVNSATQAKLNEALNQQSDSIQKQDNIGVSPESFPEIMKTLQSQRIQLIIDLAGLKARREMLTKAHEGEQQRKQETNVGVIASLRKALKIEEMNLSRAKQLAEKGTMSQKAVRDAEQKLMQVEIRIAEAESRQTNSAYFGQMNINLLDCSLDLADKQARLETTDQLLAKFTMSRELIKNSKTTASLIQKWQNSVAINVAKKRALENQLEVLQQELKALK